MWVVDTAALGVARREVQVERLTAFGVRISGVKPGERIVTVGVHHLREGQKVKLLD